MARNRAKSTISKLQDRDYPLNEKDAQLHKLRCTLILSIAVFNCQDLFRYHRKRFFRIEYSPSLIKALSATLWLRVMQLRLSIAMVFQPIFLHLPLIPLVPCNFAQWCPSILYVMQRGSSSYIVSLYESCSKFAF